MGHHHTGGTGYRSWCTFPSCFLISSVGSTAMPVFENEMAQLKINRSEAELTGYEVQQNPVSLRSRKERITAAYWFKRHIANFLIPICLPKLMDKRLGHTGQDDPNHQNHLSKRRVVRKPEDIGKIWGHPDKDEVRLVTCGVRISQLSRDQRFYGTKQHYPGETKPVFMQNPIDINTSDTVSSPAGIAANH